MPMEQIHFWTNDNIETYSDMIAEDGNGAADLIVSATGWIGHTAFIDPKTKAFKADNLDDFLKIKAGFIFKARERLKNTASAQKVQYFTEDEIKSVINSICREVYPCYAKRGIEFPQIKFWKMVSRWGSCNIAKKLLAFNTNLMYESLECIEYVVRHEFTHFSHPNHSKDFSNLIDCSPCFLFST